MYQSPNHVKLWLKYFCFDPRARHGRRLSWSWRNIVSSEGSEGRGETGHHIIWYRYSNTIFSKLDLRSPLSSHLLVRWTNWTDWWLESFRFGTWSRNYSLIFLVFDKIHLSLHLWFDGYIHVISCVNLFFVKKTFEEGPHLLWLYTSNWQQSNW